MNSKFKFHLIFLIFISLSFSMHTDCTVHGNPTELTYVVVVVVVLLVVC